MAGSSTWLPWIIALVVTAAVASSDCAACTSPVSEAFWLRSSLFRLASWVCCAVVRPLCGKAAIRVVSEVTLALPSSICRVERGGRILLG